MVGSLECNLMPAEIYELNSVVVDFEVTTGLLPWPLYLKIEPPEFESDHNLYV